MDHAFTDSNVALWGEGTRGAGVFKKRERKSEKNEDSRTYKISSELSIYMQLLYPSSLGTVVDLLQPTIRIDQKTPLFVHKKKNYRKNDVKIDDKIV